MARRRQPSGRKCRTREHVIADLGVNFVERVVLECGYTVERKTSDYGIDLVIDTYDRRGEVEVGQIRVQVKATNAIQLSAGGKAVSFRVSVADLKNWLFEIAPVILTVYDAANTVAYWLDIQDHARGLDPDSILIGRTVTLRIPVANVWVSDVVRQLRVMKNRLVDRVIRRYPDDE